MTIEHGGLDSQADREIERHFHNWERTFEAAAVANGELHVADELGVGLAFVADAGNDVFGSWLQIVGSIDTPIVTGMVKYDLRKLTVTAQEHDNTVYIVQVGFGASGTAALSARTYSTFSLRTGGGDSLIVPAEFPASQQVVGTKAWLRIKAKGEDTGTLSFFIGGHEYDF